MNIPRREFLESSLGAVSVLGFSLFELPGAGQLAAATQPAKVAEIPVLWMATGACSGCSVALLNSGSPAIQELLLDEVLPGKHVSLGFHTTVMGAAGEQAMQMVENVRRNSSGRYVLVVDGATAGTEDGLYCTVGELQGKRISGYEQVVKLSKDALAVLAVGQCAAFGGIPAAAPNPTGCLSIGEIFQREQIETPYVNIPGCPPHPDWIVGTIATLLLGGLEALKLDQQHRPAPFFQQCIHDNCQYRGHFERGQFAEHYGEHGCLIKLGCKGPITYADCPIRKFNNGTSWCCEAGHPCIGCCHPDFPLIYADADKPRQPNTSTYVAVGLIGVGGFLAGAGVAAAARKLNSKKGKPAAAVVDTSPEEQSDGNA